MDTDRIAQKFAAIFSGYEQAHGEHILDLKPDETGKLRGKATTKLGAATDANYLAHLEGRGVSLGLIPLLENDCCWFGAIDVDVSGVVCLKETIEQLEKRVRRFELPLVVCRSKSGGAHMYMLFSAPTPAKIVQAKLSEFSAVLGYGGAEVFPKQVTRVNEQDRGNWINICYYGCLSKEKTTRYAIRNGKPIYGLAEFVKYAELMQMSPVEAKDSKVVLLPIFQDGPPCLQHIATIGLEQGGRNNALTNVAIYYKKSIPDNWADAVKKFNDECVNPPLDTIEVAQIITNVGRKDYFYTCKLPPINQYCDKKQCLKREFGVGNGSERGELFPIGKLTRCESKDSVRWYVEHSERDGLRMEVNSETLLSQPLMKRAWLDKFNELVKGGKGYEEMVSEKVKTADIVHDPDDASQQGQFENLLENYFSSSRPARNRDELIKGNSYLEDGRVHFRSQDLFQYLAIRRFSYKPHEIWLWLKQMGASDRQMRVKGKMIRVWTLPEPEAYEQTAISSPIGIEEAM
jgi:hypothetical protein